MKRTNSILVAILVLVIGVMFSVSVGADAQWKDPLERHSPKTKRHWQCTGFCKGQFYQVDVCSKSRSTVKQKAKSKICGCAGTVTERFACEETLKCKKIGGRC